MAQTNRPSKGGRNRLRLELEGLRPGDERPSVALTLAADDGKALHVAQVDADGSVEVPEDLLKEAHRVLIGPTTDDPQAVDPDTIARYRVRDFERLIPGGVLTVPRVVWEKWFLLFRCVTGTVRLCRRSRWWFDELYERASAPALRAASSAGEPALAGAADLVAESISLEAEAISRLRPAASIAELIELPFRCQVICNATVEVYRRTCCCRPWIIADPRLPELVRDLEDIVDGLGRVPPIPPGPWPPDPEPAPPLPYELIKEGALDERAVNAGADLAALRSLSPKLIPDYVNARPYLICRRTCGVSTKVATGSVGPDGRFSICWRDWPRLRLLDCRDEYAYIVKQSFGPFVLTVYNGVASNIWFSASTDASLVSYSPYAYACRNNGEPGDGAYVFLDLIGDTESWNLKTPAAAGWDRVAAPAFNDGLVFPASAIAAKGHNLNRNWGGTLKLNYKFSEDMRAAPVGAVYYRIGIAAAADATGEPVATPDYLSAGLSWDKSEPDGMGGVNIVAVNLGPFTVGGQSALFKIPYDADGDWNAGQYHGFLDTTDARWSDPTKRHLVTVEVFDAGGVRLRPNGTPATGAGGAETAKPFTFRRRFQDVGPTADVPFGALTHMFWWDNRAPQALIHHLNKDGLVFSEECLFLLGTATSTFGIGYRAYLPEEMFQRFHRISWQRGLGGFAGSSGTLVPTVGDPGTDNVGQPPDPPGNSPTNTFAQMLRTDLDPTRKKCAFTVFLTTYAKTTDGDNLYNPWITKTAAFAIEIN
jgi:hypothetical protein